MALPSAGTATARHTIKTKFSDDGNPSVSVGGSAARRSPTPRRACASDTAVDEGVPWRLPRRAARRRRDQLRDQPADADGPAVHAPGLRPRAGQRQRRDALGAGRPGDRPLRVHGSLGACPRTRPGARRLARRSPGRDHPIRECLVGRAGRRRSTGNRKPYATSSKSGSSPPVRFRRRRSTCPGRPSILRFYSCFTACWEWSRWRAP